MPIALSSSGGTYTVASSAGMFFAARNPASVAVAVVGNAECTTPEAFDHRACVFEPKLASARWPLSAGIGAGSSHATDMYFARGPSWLTKSRTPFATHSAVSDGEIICVGADGKPRFRPADVPARTADLLRLGRARD